MIKVYGVPQSRAFRVLWALRELGLEFENVPTSFAGGTRSAEFLKLNPNGHIPVLVDGTTVLWESMAINLYLARQYGAGTLWPASVPDEGRAFQWSFWGMTEVEASLLQVLMHRRILPKEQRDAAVAGARGGQAGGPVRRARRRPARPRVPARRELHDRRPQRRLGVELGRARRPRPGALAAARGVARALHRRVRPAKRRAGDDRPSRPHLDPRPARAQAAPRWAMIVHRSNRTERLVDALAEVVARPPADPFAPEMIVVQGNGMERWLAMELARRLGVWANPRFPFPRTVIEQAAAAVLGAPPPGRDRRSSPTR